MKTLRLGVSVAALSATLLSGCGKPVSFAPREQFWRYHVEDVTIEQRGSYQMETYDKTAFDRMLARAGNHYGELVAVMPLHTTAHNGALNYRLIFKQPSSVKDSNEEEIDKEALTRALEAEMKTNRLKLDEKWRSLRAQ